MKPTEWVISIREDVRRVAAHPCLYGEGAQCGECATCRARKDLDLFDRIKPMESAK